jgi:hypothetical protein
MHTLPTIKVNLGRVRLNAGGYDNHGSYWGRGAPLYAFIFERDGECITGYVRAQSREQAKILVRRDHCPQACFYR